MTKKTRMTVVVVETDSDSAVATTLKTLVESLTQQQETDGAKPAPRVRTRNRGLPKQPSLALQGAAAAQTVDTSHE